MKKILAGLIRHLLTTIGGAGVTIGSEAEQMAGAVLIIIGAVASVLSKKREADQDRSTRAVGAARRGTD